MRPLALPPPPPATSPFEQWVINAIIEIDRASQSDMAEIFDSYSSNSVPTANRILNVSAPSLANLSEVLATLIEDHRGRGVSVGEPT